MTMKTPPEGVDTASAEAAHVSGALTLAAEELGVDAELAEEGFAFDSGEGLTVLLDFVAHGAGLVSV